GTPTAYPARVAMVRAERAVAEVGMDVFGGAALVEDSFADNAFRDALVAGVAGGTYEVQRNLIAGLVLGLPRH
ncbi:MAG: acyl-CoA dehydrogenase family protein, partial [Ilumatobacteraceae bacterium]